MPWNKYHSKGLVEYQDTAYPHETSGYDFRPYWNQHATQSRVVQILIFRKENKGPRHPHSNFQTWQTFQYAKGGLTEQHKSLT